MKGKKLLTALVLCIIAATMLFPAPVQADTGPKPSVRITFENMGDELCYGTLLSEDETTGPARAWDGVSEYYSYQYDEEEGYPIWQAFLNYEDSDGYYFLQLWWTCSETGELKWTYYPPDKFKVLLYYPDRGEFLVSEICERYAFDSYFSVDVDKMASSFDSASGADSVTQTGEPDGTINAISKNYDYTWEIISLVCRIIITLLVEIGIAWSIGFRNKKVFRFIAGTNLLTQIVLNVALNIANYTSGQYAFVANYILYEIIVFAIETALYLTMLNKLSDKPISKGKIVAYTFTANLASFGIGLFAAIYIPGIF